MEVVFNGLKVCLEKIKKALEMVVTELYILKWLKWSILFTYILQFLKNEFTEHIFMRKVNINSIKTANLFTIVPWKCLVLIMMTFHFNQYFQIWSPNSGELLAPHHSTIANTGNDKPNFCFSYYFRCNPKLRGRILGCWWRGVDN